MAENYSFFSNKKCEYFPCHKVSDKIAEEDFNCLFCYCPLYLKERCPGNPVYLVTANGENIKDCSECTFPHRAANYGKVLECLMEKDEILEVEINELIVDMEAEIEKSCGFDTMDAEMKRQHKEIISASYDKFFVGKRIEVLLKELDKSVVTSDRFVFGEEKIKCNALERMNVKDGDIDCIYLYTFGIKEIAATDVLRDWLRKYIERKHSVRHKKYVSDSFGPGFYGMDVDAVPKLVKLIDGGKVGVSTDENGNMHPVKSCIGIFIVTKKECVERIKDCAFCIGNKGGCAVCRGKMV